MKVLKFGGTSVGTVESLSNVKKIVEALPDGCVVVVSALGGITDRLIATARLAAAGDESYRAETEAIAHRHFDVIAGVVAEIRRKEVIERVGDLLQELRRIYDGVFLLREISARTLDVIVSFGERMSSAIVTAMIPGASLHDSMSFIKTEKWFDRNIADSSLTSALIRKDFSSMPGRVAIAPGFISTDRDSGEITNLGRGGSDFTAALISAALDAELLEIWTDVDGFMTADPRIIPDARIIPEMSFVESMELCSFGAKVIYPPTIYPVFHKNIPIKILNTFNAEAPGTLITDISEPDSECPVRGVSAIKEITLLSLKGDLTGNVPQINSRSFNALARKGVNVLLVSQPDSDNAFSFAVAGNDARKALEALEDEFAPELTSGALERIDSIDSLSTIAVVGEHLKAATRVGPRILNTLMRDGIDVKAFSTGVSETTATFVVEADMTSKALILIHNLFFPSPLPK